MPQVPNLLFNGAHVIEGATLRPFRGASDLPGMAAARAACAQRDAIDPLSSLETVPSVAEVAEALKPTTEFEPERDVLVAEAESEIIGYSVVIWWRERGQVVLYLVRGWTRPDWRGRGLGTAMLHWGEARARERAAVLPVGDRPVFGTNASQTERDTAALLVNEGYAVAFAVIEMERPADLALPLAVLPPGFTTRAAVEADLPAIHAALQASFAGHPFSGPQSYEDFLAEQGDVTDWYVAWDAATGAVAGMVRAGPLKGRGEIWECAVAPGYRRRGLARALVTQGLAGLAQRGIPCARLYTLRENPDHSWAVYESVGFRTIKRFDRYRKPM